ncbi:MAG TPA: cupin domain-containing protein [Gaiellaceae bacterium]
MTVNIFGDEWEGGRDRPGWRWKRLPVGEKLGAERIGASLYELAPGQRTFPYHWQVIEEEWLIVLRGEPTLRDPAGERRLAAGDVVVFRRGPEGAHSIRNDTEEPVRFLLLSSDRESAGEIAFYPDGGKVGIFGEGIRRILDENAELDYFAGEEPEGRASA